MNRHSCLLAGALALWVAMGSYCEVRAQYRGGVYPGAANPYNPKPAVSPYLNLLQPRGSFNLPQYQSFVKPLLDQQAINERNAFDNQITRRQVNSLQNQFNGAAVGPGRATGHPTRYMNYSHYYPLAR